MQREEGPKASIKTRRKALGPQSASEVGVSEVPPPVPSPIPSAEHGRGCGLASPWVRALRRLFSR